MESATGPSGKAAWEKARAPNQAMDEHYFLSSTVRSAALEPRAFAKKEESTSCCVLMFILSSKFSDKPQGGHGRLIEKVRRKYLPTS